MGEIDAGVDDADDDALASGAGRGAERACAHLRDGLVEERTLWRAGEEREIREYVAEVERLRRREPDGSDAGRHLEDSVRIRRLTLGDGDEDGDAPIVVGGHARTHPSHEWTCGRLGANDGRRGRVLALGAIV